MEFLSFNVSTFNGIDSIEDLASIYISVFSEKDDTVNYIEINILREEYIIKHENVKKSLYSLEKIASEGRNSCYIDNLRSYINLILKENNISQNFTLVTSDLLGKSNIIKYIFDDYNLDLFNCKVENPENFKSPIDLIDFQIRYFKKMFKKGQ